MTRHGGQETPGGPTVLMSVDAVGGVWRYAMELARSLSQRGFGFVFAVLGPAPSPAQELEAQQYGRLVRLDQPLEWMVENREQLAGVGPALSALTDSIGADLIHLNAPTQAAGLATGVPVVCVSHSCLPTWWSTVRKSPLPRDWMWHERLNQAGFDASNAIVAPSVSHAQAIADCYGITERVEVVFNSASGHTSHLPREPMLFAAGRWWDEGKNGSTLAAAAPMIDWPVVMAGACSGPGGDYRELQNVHLAGPIPHDAVLGYMRQAEIVVSPSVYEPFGLAALEGARAGAALLLADIATYRELWDGAACFFDPDDPADLALKAGTLIADADARHDHAKRAAARSAAFTPERQAIAMDAIYRRVLAVPAGDVPERV